MGLFKNVVAALSGKPNAVAAPAAPAASKPIEEMSLQEAIAFIKSDEPSSNTTHAWIALTQRLYTIALYDNHTPDQERQGAWTLLQSVKETVEKAYEKSPQALAAYRQANALMESEAKIRGVGSLAWLLKEHAVANADMVPFVMRPEHGHLLGNLVHMLGAGWLATTKPLMLRQLVWTRRPREVFNAVLVLHGLACAADPAVRALLSQSDLVTLRGAHNDYNAARELLAGLGLLPTRSNAKNFYPQLSVEEMVCMLMLMLKDERDYRQASVSYVEFARDLSEDQKAHFGLAGTLLDFHLATTVVRNVYGEDVAAEFRNALGKRVPRDIGSNFESMLRIVEKADEFMADQTNFSVDSMILDSVMGYYVGPPHGRTDEELNSVKGFLNRGGELLTIQRITVLDRFRFLLRFMVESRAKGGSQQMSEVDKATLKELGRLYAQFGSEAGLAENAGYAEDWIGSGEPVPGDETPRNRVDLGTLAMYPLYCFFENKEPCTDWREPSVSVPADLQAVFKRAVNFYQLCVWHALAIDRFGERVAITMKAEQIKRLNGAEAGLGDAFNATLDAMQKSLAAKTESIRADNKDLEIPPELHIAVKLLMLWSDSPWYIFDADIKSGKGGGKENVPKDTSFDLAFCLIHGKNAAHKIFGPVIKHAEIIWDGDKAS